MALGPTDIPRLAETVIDLRVLAFTVVISILTALLFGLVPAWAISRTNPNDSLKEGGRSASSGRRRGQYRQTAGRLGVWLGGRIANRRWFAEFVVLCASRRWILDSDLSVFS